MKSIIFLVIVILLTTVMTSCSDKKEVKTHFTNANEAFSYFIDTTGLVRDKKDSKLYVCKTKTQSNNSNVKFITVYNYDFSYTPDGTLTKDLDNIKVSVYNSNHQLKSYFITSYGEHCCDKYIYNSNKQLVKIITWDDMNPSNVSRKSSITTFKYSTSQDSVLVESKLYTGSANTSKYSYKYSKELNFIYNKEFSSIKLNPTDTQIAEFLFRTSKDRWNYFKSHVTFY